MASILLVIGALLVLIMVLLAVPLDIMFSIHRIENTKGYVHIRWLFGLVRFQVRIPQDVSAEPQPKSTPKKKPESPRQTKKKGSSRGIASLLKQSAFRGRVIQFVRDILHATHAKKMFLRLRIGLGDPAETGRLWALIGPIAGLVQNLRNAEVSIEPEFIDPLFEVETHGQFRLVPIQFIALTMVFILSPTTLRAWRQSRQGNV